MHAVSPIASFRLGQIVRHKEHGYRGVVYDVDPAYQGSDEWFRRNSGQRPPSKESPWYYVIVDEEDAEGGPPHEAGHDEGQCEFDGALHELISRPDQADQERRPHDEAGKIDGLAGGAGHGDRLRKLKRTQ